MPESTEQISAEVAALKSGLGPFYGRLLAAAERIADALEATSNATDKLSRSRKSDA